MDKGGEGRKMRRGGGGRRGGIGRGSWGGGGKGSSNFEISSAENI